MTPFGKWLAEIGLEHHGAVFASNESHFDVIRNADVLRPAHLNRRFERGLPSIGKLASFSPSFSRQQSEFTRFCQVLNCEQTVASSR
jgi:hypothetical protein